MLLLAKQKQKNQKNYPILIEEGSRATGSFFLESKCYYIYQMQFYTLLVVNYSPAPLAGEYVQKIPSLTILRGRLKSEAKTPIEVALSAFDWL